KPRDKAPNQSAKPLGTQACGSLELLSPASDRFFWGLCPASIILAGRRQSSWPVEARREGFNFPVLMLRLDAAQKGRAPSEQRGGGNSPHSSRRWSRDARGDRPRPASS